MKTGNCEPITLKRANNSPIVVKNSTHKRFFVSDVQVPDGNIKLFPLTMQRKQCTMFRIEICAHEKMSKRQTFHQSNCEAAKMLMQRSSLTGCNEKNNNKQKREKNSESKQAEKC